MTETKAENLTHEVQEQLINKIITTLRQKYVLKDKVPLFVEMLQNNWENGNYDIKDPVDFANKVDQDLMDVYADKHLKFTYFNEETGQFSGMSRAKVVRMSPSEIKGMGDESTSSHRVVKHSSDYPENQSKTLRKPKLIKRSTWSEGPGLVESKIIANNIGYLNIELFKPLSDEEKEKYDQATSQLLNTDGLIIDLRQCRGGTPESISYLSSWLFGEQKVLLAKTYFRENDETLERWTTPWPAPSYKDKPVIVLTSDFTGSGGESFAYSLQHLNRAKLIGENTAGAGLMVSFVELGHHFQLNVSVGRTFDPKTGDGFEFVGVSPDISINAELALEKALKELQSD